MTAVATTGAQDNARAMLSRALKPYQQSMANVLPKHLTPERMLSLTLVAAVKTPKLLDCTPESIALSVLRVAQWGLEIGTTAHLVPFGNVCTPIADWKGVAELLLRSGHVRKVWARAVYANERFVVKYGTDDRIEHDPITAGDRGALVAVYAVAIVRGGLAEFEVMPVEEVNRIRSGARSANSDAWRNHFDEMAKKTVLRRLAKRLPQTAAVADALDSEDGVLPRVSASMRAEVSEPAPMTGKPPMLGAGDYGDEGEPEPGSRAAFVQRMAEQPDPYEPDGLALDDARPTTRRTSPQEAGQ